MRLSIDSLQHLQDYFSSPRVSSRCLPSFSLRRRLLGLRRRSFRTPGCRSGVDLDDLGDKKDYEEMLAKKVKAWHRRRPVPLVFRLNVQANFPEQRHAQAGPLAGYIAMCSLPDGSISGLCESVPRRIFLLGLLVISGAATGTQVLHFAKKIRSVPHFLQPPAIDKEPESNAKMCVNQRRDETA